MPAPHEIIPRLEGFNGYIAASTDQDSQFAYNWVEDCKRIMRQTSLRGLTTWEFVTTDSVIDTAVDQISTSASTLYAVMIRSNAAAVDRILFVNATTNAYDETAAMDAVDLLCLYANAHATEGTERWTPYTMASGIVFGTALSVNADGIGGGAPTAADIDVWALFTDDS